MARMRPGTLTPDEPLEELDPEELELELDLDEPEDPPLEDPPPPATPK